MYPECPTEDWWDKSCWLNPRESDPDVIQGLGGVAASPILLRPVLVWRQQNYLKLLLTAWYSKFSYGCCPRNSSGRKTVMKMNEINNICVSLFTGGLPCKSSCGPRSNLSLRSLVYIINSLLAAICMCSWAPHLFDCKPRLIHFLIIFMRFTFFIFCLSKGIDDAQSFLGYVLSTKFFRIRFSSASRAQRSQAGLW